MSESLELCPMCGSVARRSLAQPKNGPNNYVIGCSRCIIQTEWTATEAEAIAAWNRRVPATPPPDAELDALCEALERADLYKTIHHKTIKAIRSLRIAREVGTKALERTREGWSNAIEFGLIPPQHRNVAQILADEARAAIAAMTGEKADG